MSTQQLTRQVAAVDSGIGRASGFELTSRASPASPTSRPRGGGL